MNKSLKEKTVHGILWSFAERFGYLLLQFITNLVLARLLTPDDFGLIGMMMVFIGLCTIMIDGGFGAALIQKKDPTHNDYSTIFYTNILISIVFYLGLFLIADTIAEFYSQPQLSNLVRILGFVLVFDSFSIIQNNILVKNLQFKQIAKIKISAAFLSSLIGIILALKDFGVWSLVVQYLTNSVMRTLFFWIRSSWHPTLIFSITSFKALFRYGSKLLLASFISEFYRNFQSLLIGRVFTPKDLGFYTQAKQLQTVPSTALMMIINQVTFPVFSQMRSNVDKLIMGIRSVLKSLVFVNFPIMILMAVVAKPLFVFLFTEKWLPSVPYFQLLCLGFGLLLVVHNLNLNVLKSIGRSDLVLRLEVIKKAIGIALILILLRFGIIGILLALWINSIIEFFLNGYYTGKCVGYGILKQIKDIAPTLVISSLIGLLTWLLFRKSSLHPLFAILAQVLMFGILYFGTAKIIGLEALHVYIAEIRKITKH